MKNRGSARRGRSLAVTHHTPHLIPNVRSSIVQSANVEHATGGGWGGGGGGELWHITPASKLPLFCEASPRLFANAFRISWHTPRTPEGVLLQEGPVHQVKPIGLVYSAQQ